MRRGVRQPHHLPDAGPVRSRQPGQHWLTVLGVVTDAAAISVAAVEGASSGPAGRLCRRSTRLLRGFRALSSVGSRAAATADGPGGDETRFRAHYRRLGELGLPLRPYEPAWADLRRLRAAYLPELVAATEELLVPLEFRHGAVAIDVGRPP